MLCKVVEGLGLSYKTENKLNSIINNNLPGCPPFKTQELVIRGECLEFHYQEILPSIQAIFGNLELAHDMVFAPE